MFQKCGKHGSVRDWKAVGSRWTKAVAMRTPVPKCREMKRTGVGGTSQLEASNLQLLGLYAQ